MAALGMVAFGVYAVVIPRYLFMSVNKAYKANQLWNNEDFLESHGWLVLKYSNYTSTRCRCL